MLVHVLVVSISLLHSFRRILLTSLQPQRKPLAISKIVECVLTMALFLEYLASYRACILTERSPRSRKGFQNASFGRGPHLPSIKVAQSFITELMLGKSSIPLSLCWANPTFDVATSLATIRTFHIATYIPC